MFVLSLADGKVVCERPQVNRLYRGGRGPALQGLCVRDGRQQGAGLDARELAPLQGIPGLGRRKRPQTPRAGLPKEHPEDGRLHHPPRQPGEPKVPFSRAQRMATAVQGDKVVLCDGIGRQSERKARD